MFVRTTRFLFLVLLASACTLVFSGKALAESQTENDTPQTTSISTVEQSSQQTLESTHETTEVSVNEHVITENHTLYQSSETEDTTNTIVDHKSNNTLSTSQSKLASFSNTEQTNSDARSITPTSSKLNTSLNYYSYTKTQSNFYNTNQVSQSAFPTTLQSSKSSGSLPLPVNLPFDGTGLVLRMLATVLQSVQNIVVTNPQLTIVDSQIKPSSASLYLVVYIGLTTLFILVLLSLLLRLWRKSGFTNAARSDVGDLNMIFAVTEREFVYYFTSSFFVTANIKNKTT